MVTSLRTETLDLLPSKQWPVVIAWDIHCPGDSTHVRPAGCASIRDREGTALVLVGAGVSIGATRGQVVQVGKKTFPLASWTGLLHHGVTFCEQWVKADLPRGWSSGKPMQSPEINVGDCGSLIGAGTKIEEKLKAPEGLYITWLQSSDGALKIVDGSVLEAIAALGLPIATTNYDRLLETITGQPRSTGRRSLRSSDLR